MPNKRSRAPQSFQKEGRASPTRGGSLGPEICTVGNPDGNQHCGFGGWARLSKKAERHQISSKDSGDSSSNTLARSVEATLSGM